MSTEIVRQRFNDACTRLLIPLCMARGFGSPFSQDDSLTCEKSMFYKSLALVVSCDLREGLCGCDLGKTADGQGFNHRVEWLSFEGKIQKISLHLLVKKLNRVASAKTQKRSLHGTKTARNRRLPEEEVIGEVECFAKYVNALGAADFALLDQLPDLASYLGDLRRL